MNPSALEQPRRFATTRWSVVLAAARTPTPQSREALETLCRAYWYPLYTYVRRRGEPPEAARDLTQAFLTRLIEKNDFAAADPGKGRFRSWLLGALKHFLANQHDAAQAQKRGGGAAIVSIDTEDAEGRYTLEPADLATPEALYERRWAIEVLTRVLGRLEAECSGKKRELFERLRARLLDDTGESLGLIGEELGMSEVAVKVAWLRLRTRYRALLAEEVSQTLDDTAAVDEELRSLLAAFTV